MTTSNMFEKLSKTFMAQQFRRVDNVVWDLMSNTTGIMTKSDAIATFSYDNTSESVDGLDGSITINPLATMSMAIPAYGQKVSADKISLGDIVVNGNGQAYGWVTNKLKNGKFAIIDVDGKETKISPPTVNVMGIGDQVGLMVVKPLFALTGGNTDAFKNMLMPLMLLNDGNVNENEMDKMMQMMLMTSAMGGDAGGNNMMQTMMMMKMMGGSSF